jgi:phage major head subunit gpT-like protein
MPTITPANQNLFFTDLDTRFWQAYGAAPSWYQQLCTEYPCTTEQMAFGWMGMLDKPRLWNGSRTVHSPAPQTYLVTPQPFELTEAIDQFKLDDDQHGIYMPIAAAMGESIRKWPDFEVRDLMKNQGEQTGTKQLGLDGLNHWSAVHPVDFYDAAKGTYCNDFTGGGVSVNSILTGGALSPNAYATLWQEFASRKSEMNEPLGLIPNLTAYAPQLKLTADIILQASFFSPDSLGNMNFNVGSTSNVLAQSTDGLCVPDFAADGNTWYMFCTNRGVKPLSWVSRLKPDFVVRNQPQDPLVFDTHTYVMGSKMRGCPAWSHAWLSARSGP